MNNIRTASAATATILLLVGLIASCQTKGSELSNLAVITQSNQTATANTGDDVILQTPLPNNRVLLWTTGDVLLIEDGTAHSLFRDSMERMYARELKRISHLASERKSQFAESAQVSVVSIVGTVITFEVRFMRLLNGGTADNRSWWLTVDVSKEGEILPFEDNDIENSDCRRIISITEILPERQVLSALLQNPEIASALAEQRRLRAPNNLNELFTNDGKYRNNPRIATDDGNYFLTPYSMEHFSFGRVENGRINIKFALESFALARSYNVQSLEVSLPIPEKLSAAISDAEAKNHGFLYDAGTSVANGRVTLISLE